MRQIIDLRSDTVTQPGPEMLEAMLSAKVGDDVFGDDPTVIELEEKAALMFGKEKALFCPSGTMTNQIAIKVHTKPGDEIICDESSHVYRYEGGGIGMNSGASVRLIQGVRGRITAEQVLQNINPDDPHYPVSRLVVAENTSNRGGGSCYDLGDLQKISQACKENNLRFHLDGARLFNAIIKTENDTQQIGAIFDSVSICLSKGLGAPVGSLLIGNSDFIKHARRVRKVFGGGMRQSGYMAAAGLYALNHNIKRLEDDHRRAHQIYHVLKKCNFVKEILDVETNIIVFKLSDNISDKSFLTTLESKGIRAIGFGPQTIRLVTHLDFTDDMLEQLLGELRSI
ncbi:MAG: aminotransferase class I/II-fold pyridoxal phosphate-dependent enzyme [Bacteroidales bacterium]|nr:aminotransferase class I/II-fold pyridoxal phosphate-dependent enzyme [Bacteroidales bacterium]MCF8405137.1 aminotransferase class I/II-fold pyridoxal phosphate-dependent enzyme [Bacteroidales bacterium]